MKAIDAMKQATAFTRSQPEYEARIINTAGRVDAEEKIFFRKRDEI